jgi:hypothetical protein
MSSSFPVKVASGLCCKAAASFGFSTRVSVRVCVCVCWRVLVCVGVCVCVCVCVPVSRTPSTLLHFEPIRTGPPCSEMKLPFSLWKILKSQCSSLAAKSNKHHEGTCENVCRSQSRNVGSWSSFTSKSLTSINSLDTSAAKSCCNASTSTDPGKYSQTSVP